MKNINKLLFAFVTLIFINSTLAQKKNPKMLVENILNNWHKALKRKRVEPN